MKFVISYSCGKDSTLALHKMLAAGHQPVGLLVMVNQQAQRSWFHGVEPELLAAIADCLQIPLICCYSRGDGKDYHTVLEEGLRQAKDLGATACVFGDIDIQDHFDWGVARCQAVGLQAVFPLWQRNRRENTEEILALGYQCLIKCIRNQDLPQRFLGNILDAAMVAEMAALGVDVCGENGEYHTLVVDGPIFRRPVPYCCQAALDLGNISVVPVTIKKAAGLPAAANR